MVKRICIFVLVVLIIPLCTITINAEETDMPDEYGELLDELPSDVADLLPDGLFSDDPDSVLDAVSEMSGWEFLLDTVFKVIGLNFRDIVSILASITSVLVISSLFRAMKKTLKNEATAGVLQ